MTTEHNMHGILLWVGIVAILFFVTGNLQEKRGSAVLLILGMVMVITIPFFLSRHINDPYSVTYYHVTGQADLGDYVGFFGKESADACEIKSFKLAKKDLVTSTRKQVEWSTSEPVTLTINYLTVQYTEVTAVPE